MTDLKCSTNKHSLLTERVVRSSKFGFSVVFVVDGRWSSWGAWGTCSKACGTGNQHRKRYCNNPPPSNGGKTCSGTSVDYRQCHIQSCSGLWLFVGSTFIRDYNLFPFSCLLDLYHHHIHGFETIVKNITTNLPPSLNFDLCAFLVNGGWSPWGKWWRCSKICGTGEQYRKRYCTNPRPSNGGKTCSGTGRQTRQCNTHSCSGW